MRTHYTITHCGIVWVWKELGGTNNQVSAMCGKKWSSVPAYLPPASGRFLGYLMAIFHLYNSCSV